PLRTSAAPAALTAALSAAGRWRLKSGCCQREAADGHEYAQHHHTLHERPPGKKTRCTNQNAPATMTTSDPANARCLPAHSLRDRSDASADATSTTTRSWPISTPMLNEKSDHPSARDGRSISRSTFANPNP